MFYKTLIVNEILKKKLTNWISKIGKKNNLGWGRG